MIRIIISPAKKMNIVPEGPVLTHPVFLNRARELRARLSEMSFEELEQLWECNEKIAFLNLDRLHTLSLDRNLTAAALAYEGLQYQHLAPQILSDAGWNYINEHLRILSGFYGILRPSDGIIPYRLEMQAKLATDAGKDLYAFWGNSLYKALVEPETPNRREPVQILNLASAEYSKAILPFAEKGQVTTCTFGELSGSKVRTKGTLAKMARGEMVRWMAENQIETLSDLSQFHALGYHYAPEHSSEGNLVFLASVAP